MDFESVVSLNYTLDASSPISALPHEISLGLGPRTEKKTVQFAPLPEKHFAPFTTARLEERRQRRIRNRMDYKSDQEDSFLSDLDEMLSDDEEEMQPVATPSYSPVGDAHEEVESTNNKDPAYNNNNAIEALNTELLAKLVQLKEEERRRREERHYQKEQRRIQKEQRRLQEEERCIQEEERRLQEDQYSLLEAHLIEEQHRQPEAQSQQRLYAAMALVGIALVFAMLVK